MAVITITQDKPLQWSLQSKAKSCLVKDLQWRQLQGNIQAVPESDGQCQLRHPCRQSSMVVKHSWSLKTFLDVGEPSWQFLSKVTPSPPQVRGRKIKSFPCASQLQHLFPYLKLPAMRILVGKDLSYNVIVVETGGSNSLEIINCYK